MLIIGHASYVFEPLKAVIAHKESTANANASGCVNDKLARTITGTNNRRIRAASAGLSATTSAIGGLTR